MIWFHLPDDIRSMIHNYIIKQDIAIISKTYFKLYYDVPEKKLLRRCLLNIIRRDLFNKYYIQFKKLVHYRYDGKRYKHFAEFLKYRIIENQSMKCKIVIFEKLTNEYKWM